MLIDPGYPGYPDHKRQAWIAHKHKHHNRHQYQPINMDMDMFMPAATDPLQVPLIQTRAVYMPTARPRDNSYGSVWGDTPSNAGMSEQQWNPALPGGQPAYPPGPGSGMLGYGAYGGIPTGLLGGKLGYQDPGMDAGMHQLG